MKKIVLSLFTLLFISSCLFGQKHYNAVSVTVGYQKDPNKALVFEETKQILLPVTITEKTVSFNDEAKSKYTTHGLKSEKKGDGFTLIIWNALDKKQKDCILSLTYTPGKEGVLLMVANGESVSIYHLIDRK